MRASRCLAWFACAIVVAAAGAAWAVGEMIRDVRIEGAVRTNEDTVRAIAGVSIGDSLDPDTLDKVRERLNTSGLFSDVNVFWEPYRDGVRVVISVGEKFPWAPLPTFSRSAGNTSFGLVLVHGNLFGAGKQGVIGGRLSTADSGAAIGYRDPALFGSWAYYQFNGRFQDQTIPEFANDPVHMARVIPLRETKLRSLGFEARAGVAWFRRVKTEVGWHYEKYDVRRSMENPDYEPPLPPLPPAMTDIRIGYAMAQLTFDFRAREQAVLTGNSLSAGVNFGNPTWGSDSTIDFWKLGAGYEHGFRLFRRHNLIFHGEFILGERLPMPLENYIGGTSLRGYVYQQFRGDTQASAQAEYHFPLFSIRQLDFRGLVFYDAAALWWRKLPPIDPATGTYFVARNGRDYLPPEYLKEGFDAKRDIHQSVGAGLRFFLRSVAVPLVGVDFGFGFDQKAFRVVIVLGA
jgi:outer membrane protein assembly factor BamA